mmetsp:Transcript_11057/g.21179  ORF Transcript_11057/g.21179 Transcript_11057/m.21179 type:complete len:152 (-) Transcript_11057:960-1415(-)
MYRCVAMPQEMRQTFTYIPAIFRSAFWRSDLSSRNSFANDYSTYGQHLQRPYLTSSTPSEIRGRKGTTSFVHRASYMVMVLTIFSSFGARSGAQPFEWKGVPEILSRKCEIAGGKEIETETGKFYQKENRLADIDEIKEILEAVSPSWSTY